MISDFDFVGDAALAEPAKEAERLIASKFYVQALGELRRFVERLGKELARRHGLFVEGMLLNDLEQLLVDHGILNQETRRLFRSLRLDGNKAVHEGLGDEHLARRDLDKALSLARWFDGQYGGRAEAEAEAKRRKEQEQFEAARRAEQERAEAASRAQQQRGAGEAIRPEANKQAPGQNVGDDSYCIDISLEDAFHGKRAEISVWRSVGCDTCKGSGAEPGWRRLACSTCQGLGNVRREKKLFVDIPPGIEGGAQIRLAGAGEAGLHGGSPSDLYVSINVASHPIFRRNGADLFCRLPIPLATANAGGIVESPTIEGVRIKVRVSGGIQSGNQIRVPGKGMTVLRSAERGDMYIQAVVEAKADSRASSSKSHYLSRIAASIAIGLLVFGASLWWLGNNAFRDREVESQPSVELAYDGNPVKPSRYGDIVMRADSAPGGQGNRIPIAIGAYRDRPAFSVRMDSCETSVPNLKMTIARLDPGATIPQVIISCFTGGAHCCTVTEIAVANSAADWKVIDAGTLDGDFPYQRMDLDRDGGSELISIDNSFLYAFDCYACSAAPTRIQKLVGGNLTDVTGLAKYQSFLRERLRQMESDAQSQGHLHSNGYLAGWVAAKLLVGELDDAWP
jgi:DnaJ-class molecular chaperone